jgi:vancomycin resistance protein VanW
MKKLIPLAIRRQLKIIQRTIQDWQSGDAKHFISRKKNDVAADFLPQIEVEMAFRKAAFVENKIHNIQLAANFIEPLLFEPNQLFSFWKIVGKPSRSRGFRDGRTLRNGRVEADPGGGLCQISSAIYWLALQSGLEIVERHAHSIDIYAENARFAPLGSDATVFFGYKDLRLRNPFSFPVSFAFEISDAQMVAKICASEKVFQKKIEFERHENVGFRVVNTLIINELGTKKHIETSTYRILI